MCCFKIFLFSIATLLFWICKIIPINSCGNTYILWHYGGFSYTLRCKQLGSCIRCAKNHQHNERLSSTAMFHQKEKLALISSGPFTHLTRQTILTTFSQTNCRIESIRAYLSNGEMARRRTRPQQPILYAAAYKMQCAAYIAAQVIRVPLQGRPVKSKSCHSLALKLNS